MSEIKSRIIELRKALQLSQTEFANGIHLTQNFVSLVENGTRNFSERTIKDICDKYYVNEEWLRDGSGEMFVPMTREQEIAQLTSALFHGENSNFKRELVSYIIRSSPEQLEMIKDMIWELSKTIEKDHE